jgi:hypothetical protein
MTTPRATARAAIKWLMAHPMLRGDQPLENSVEFLKEIAAGCIQAASHLDPVSTEAMSQEMVFTAIRATYTLNNELPKMIGEALEKDAAIILLVNADGSITVVGAHKPGVPNEKRNGIMVQKISNLLGEKMKEMMLEAGKEAKEQS